MERADDKGRLVGVSDNSTFDTRFKSASGFDFPYRTFPLTHTRPAPSTGSFNVEGLSLTIVDDKVLGRVPDLVIEVDRLAAYVLESELGGNGFTEDKALRINTQPAPQAIDRPTPLRFRGRRHMASMSDELLQSPLDGWKSEIPRPPAGVKDDLAVNIDDGHANRSGQIVAVDLAVHTVDHHRYREFVFGDAFGRQDDPLVEVFRPTYNACFVARL